MNSRNIYIKLKKGYTEICVMDLSFQTLEEMIKHTKLKRYKYILKQFMYANDTYENLNFEHDYCSTLEGKVVTIADEIAQRAHDLNDALSLYAMCFKDFQKYLTVKKMKDLSDIVQSTAFL